MDKQVHHYTIALPIDQAERLQYRAEKMEKKPGPAIVKLLKPILSKGPRRRLSSDK